MFMLVDGVVLVVGFDVLHILVFPFFLLVRALYSCAGVVGVDVGGGGI